MGRHKPPQEFTRHKFYGPNGPADSQEEADRLWALARRRRQRTQARYENWEAIEANRLDLSDVSPEEVVALYRLTGDEIASAEAGTAWAHDSLGLHARLHFTLETLTLVDQHRANAVFTAFANSPLPEDRKQLAGQFIGPFTMYHDPDGGIELWDQLMRDPDKEVRDAAEGSLLQVLTDCRRDRRRRLVSGMYAVEQVDASKLDERGLSPESAYRLMESYAYAEHGQDLHSLGRVALGRLTVPEQHPTP